MNFSFTKSGPGRKHQQGKERKAAKPARASAGTNPEKPNPDRRLKRQIGHRQYRRLTVRSYALKLSAQLATS